MKTKRLFSLSPLLILTLSPLLLFPQSPKPSNWNDIIASRWYFGEVNKKTLYIYLDSINPSTGYFFVADKAIPQVYTMSIKWKKGTPHSVSFMKEGSKIKAKFSGTVASESLSGQLKTSRKNAIKLGLSPQIDINFIKEPQNLPASSPPRLPAPTPSRYNSPTFASVSLTEDVSYGAATGYYTSMPVETEGYDYQQILLDAMEKMYVNPTKEAILHILNKDPVSFALTDFQPLRMDIYQPTGDDQQNRPLILLLHGGAFILGDKATASIRELASDFAKKGYVVASVNYRIGFNPASKSSLERAAYRAVQDARAALRFLSANAQKYRIDPHWVFLGGSSAGAITALNVAFMKEEERPESTERNIWRAQVDLGELDESTNTISGSFNIRAVVNLWGAVNDTSLIDSYEKIPVLSVHGDADKIVPYNAAYPFLDLDTSLTSNIVSKLYGSKLIHERLTNLGIHSELITLKGSGHEPQSEPGKYRMVMDTILARSTEFYFHSMFGFPEITGPHQIAMGMNPPTYSIPSNTDLRYSWTVTGGKILPGSDSHSVRVVFLDEEEAEVTVVMEHRNGASAEMGVRVEVP